MGLRDKAGLDEVGREAVGEVDVLGLATPPLEQRVIDHHDDRHRGIQQPLNDSPCHQQSTPILRLRYQGSIEQWDIGIYLASDERYTESALQTSFGPRTGTPEEGIDHTFILYAGPALNADNAHRRLGWPDTRETAKVESACSSSWPPRRPSPPARPWNRRSRRCRPCARSAGRFVAQLFALGLLGASSLAAAVVLRSTACAVSEAVGAERSVSKTFREAKLSMLGTAANGRVFRVVATVIAVMAAAVLGLTVAGWLGIG